MKKEIYCPVCNKKGRKKLLGVVEDTTVGIIYFWCKEDKKEIKIKLNKFEP